MTAPDLQRDDVRQDVAALLRDLATRVEADPQLATALLVALQSGLDVAFQGMSPPSPTVSEHAAADDSGQAAAALETSAAPKDSQDGD